MVPKPPRISFEQASGLMLTGVTAFHALTRAKVAKGDTVLVHGAAGGVGLMAVQLAIDLGARVIGTAGPGGHAYLRQFGAEPVLYGPGLVDRVRAMAPEGVDAAIDTVGTDEAVDSSIALVPDRTRVVSAAAFQRGPGLGITLIGNGPGADPGTEIRAGPAWSWCAWSRRANCGSSWPLFTRWPKPGPPTGRLNPATRTARSSSYRRTSTVASRPVPTLPAYAQDLVRRSERRPHEEKWTRPAHNGLGLGHVSTGGHRGPPFSIF